jgi:type VI secretion system protein ImpB
LPTTESIQHKLSRVRPPRVQITYDVEIGDAIESKELPFVMGIMADLSSRPEEPLPRVKDRKFVEIDRDNLNDVLEASNARLEYSVPNRLDGEGNLKVELNFKDMEDFDPRSLVGQIEPLRQLFEARQRLSDLLAKLDGNDVLDDHLQQVLDNTNELNELKSQVDEARAAAQAEGESEDTDGDEPAEK